MKKVLFAGLVAVLLVGTIGTAAVFAQGPDNGPGIPWRTDCDGDCTTGMGRMGDPDEDGLGLMEDYLVAFAADKLGLLAEDIEARLDAGETLAEIAASEGVEDYYNFMLEARDYAREQMAEDGIEMPGWNRWNTDSDEESFAPPRLNYDPETCTPGQYTPDGGTVLRRGGRRAR